MKKFLTFLIAGLILFSQINTAYSQDEQKSKKGTYRTAQGYFVDINEKLPTGSCVPFETSYSKYHKAIELAENASQMKNLTYAGQKTYLGQKFYLIKQEKNTNKKIFGYAVTIDFSKVFEIEDNGKNMTDIPTYNLYEIYPDRNLKYTLKNAIKVRSYFEFPAPVQDKITSEEALSKRVKEVFTPEVYKELIELSKKVYATAPNGEYQLQVGRGADYLMGSCIFELTKETPDTKIYTIKKESREDDTSPFEIKEYKIVQKNIDGKWLFENFELYY